MQEIRKEIKEKLSPTPVFRMVEDIIGCKWSLSVLQLVQNGIQRPGLMRRHIDGLTTKVLNERLRKLIKYKILQRIVYPEIPPHVEYKFTSFGEEFVSIIKAIESLENHLRK